MRILVVEDEQVIAKRLIRMITSLLGDRAESIRSMEDLYQAQDYIQKHPIDLLFLDLNLNGADGFQLLMEAVAGSFQTIIVSAHSDQAIRAFEYGVTDFVPKPFHEERLRKALERVSAPDPANQGRTRYLAVRTGSELRSIPVAGVLYIKGADDYSEIHCEDKSVYLHDRTLYELEYRLPAYFQRLHKSYLVNMNCVTGMGRQTGSRYSAILKNGNHLPVSRKKVASLRAYFVRPVS
jgi:DNA-binding LytR/AlgR family response regulator